MLKNAARDALLGLAANRQQPPSNHSHIARGNEHGLSGKDKNTGRRAALPSPEQGEEEEVGQPIHGKPPVRHGRGAASPHRALPFEQWAQTLSPEFITLHCLPTDIGLYRLDRLPDWVIERRNLLTQRLTNPIGDL